MSELSVCDYIIPTFCISHTIIIPRDQNSECAIEEWILEFDESAVVVEIERVCVCVFPATDR